MIKEETKLKLVLFAIMGVVFLIPAIVLAVIVSPFFWAAVPAIVLVAGFGAMPAPKKDWHKLFATTVVINEDELENEGEGWSNVRKIEDVDKVWDYGDWYYITFTFPKNRSFICQKDLLKEGTLDEFERIFDSTIVKK